MPIPVTDAPVNLEHASTLRDRLEELEQRSRARALSVAVHDLESGRQFRYRADRWFHAASTIKAAILLGVYASIEEVPMLELLDAGIPISLGADDPLLFGSRLAGQYAVVRAAHGVDDPTLAELARMSIRASCAPTDVKAALLDGVDRWIRAEPAAP